jgi:hypothetical protein
MSAKIASYIAGGALLLAAGVGVVKFNESAHPASEGKEYLESKGICTAVQGGEDISLFNACGKSVMSRTYTCNDKSNRPVSRTVCFGLWKYQPLFGN